MLQIWQMKAKFHTFEVACVAKRTVEHQDSNLDLCVRMKKSQEGEEEEGKEDLGEVQREHPASHMLYPVRRYILDQHRQMNVASIAVSAPTLLRH